jgi:uncharacterized membrane protein YhaH (DUF805 family)
MAVEERGMRENVWRLFFSFNGRLSRMKFALSFLLVAIVSYVVEVTVPGRSYFLLGALLLLI